MRDYENTNELTEEEAEYIFCDLSGPTTTYSFDKTEHDEYMSVLSRVDMSRYGISVVECVKASIEAARDPLAFHTQRWDSPTCVY